ncbi:hypothetical protein J5N97_024655 [Dioscorea zingiberensis]|uniref:BHLH domain-containing protein n=1 Tax=Dioscorea zingiberensis TaxID=325984 RepID=A0A9D5C7N9_9LILI|nr:hypothetical protein J5N97_024655 [Dioscorea zingiberensis]
MAGRDFGDRPGHHRGRGCKQQAADYREMRRDSVALFSDLRLSFGFSDRVRSIVMGIGSVQRLAKLLTPQQIEQVLGQEFRPSPSYESLVITNTPSTFSCSSVEEHQMEYSMGVPKNSAIKDKGKDSSSSEQALLSAPAPQSSSSMRYLSFGNEGAMDQMVDLEILGSQSPKSFYEPSGFNVSRRGNRPPSSSSQDHVLAERKRREKLSQLFLTLSTTIPGQKKSDKHTLLGNTVDYIKELKSKVKILEEVIETPVETAVLVEKPSLMNNGESSLSSNGSLSREKPPLKIEAKINGKSVMIKVQSENHKGLVVKALLEIEKLPMTITNTSILPFGDSSLDIVIMALVEDGDSMTVRDLVENLNTTFSQILRRCT